MNNVLGSFKRIIRNKNTVTIIGVIIILILLYAGYSMQINSAVEPVQVPVATETIQPRTEITEDMVELIDVPNISLSDNVITSRTAIVGKYSNVNSVIPQGSMFYTDTVIDEEELPDSAFVKVKDGEVVYNFPVDMESTYGNSIYPGNKIDIYMKAGNGRDEQVMVGKLIENVEVLAVKDSSGRNVFENTSESRTPSMLIFGVDEEINILLRKASYMGTLGVELFPVPQGGSVTVENSTQVSTQQLVDYIEAHSVNIPITTESDEEDELLPTITQSEDNLGEVTIKFPKGCGSDYTCTYTKDNNEAREVTKRNQTVTFTANGTLSATVVEKDGTLHQAIEDIIIDESALGQNSQGSTQQGSTQ